MGEALERRQKERWSIDKKIPIVFLLALGVQTVSIVSWAARLDSRVEEHERRIVITEALDRENSKFNADLCQRVARVETKVDNQAQVLERIERYLREMTVGRR